MNVNCGGRVDRGLGGRGWGGEGAGGGAAPFPVVGQPAGQPAGQARTDTVRPQLLIQIFSVFSLKTIFHSHRKISLNL